MYLLSIVFELGRDADGPAWEGDIYDLGHIKLDFSCPLPVMILVWHLSTLVLVDGR